MNSYPDISTQLEPEAAPVVYEQPLNERMRTFLRLEFLYTQATYHSESPSPWSSRAAGYALRRYISAGRCGRWPRGRIGRTTSCTTIS